MIKFDGQRTVTGSRATVFLSPKQSTILRLILNADGFVSRELLMQATGANWQSVRVHASVLRARLREAGYRHETIINEYRRGYALAMAPALSRAA